MPKLHYKFPVIRNIGDVLPAIEGRPEFIVAKKETEEGIPYTVINYMVADSRTFPPIENDNDPNANDLAILRECRGLIFDWRGVLISRPYHKFFNVNQTPETEESCIDLSMPHSILQKMDGSMIRPLVLHPLNFGSDPIVRWATKMGITDVSIQAEEYIKSVPEMKYNEMGFYDYTPIFEWCSPDNRIVVEYETPKLVLTAIRERLTGRYASYDELVRIAEFHNVPVVSEIVSENYSGSGMDELKNYVKGLEKEEGYVIRFDDGMMVKVKGDWYCNLHKLMSDIRSERNVVRLIITQSLDDIIGNFPPDVAEKIKNYESTFWKVIHKSAYEYFTFVKRFKDSNVTKKLFAEIILEDENEEFDTGILFSIWDGRTANESILRKVESCLSSNTKLDSIRESLLGGIEYKI